MQVLGLCRFSYPAIGGFQVEHDSIEDRIAFLYQEDRLEERFQLLETVALPCLRHQSDPDFDLIIVIGDSLPKQHRDRLHDITAGMPQVQIQSHPPRNQREVMKEILQTARTDPQEPCLQFRYDDDDAVALNFIERLRKAEEDCRALTDQYRTTAFDFNTGYVAEFGPSGIAATEIHRPYYVAALGMHVRGGDKLTIMNFAHERLLRFMPTVTFSDEPMFVRSHNGYNDSRQKKVKPVPVEPLTTAQEIDFLKRFAIDADQVRATFA